MNVDSKLKYLGVFLVVIVLALGYYFLYFQSTIYPAKFKGSLASVKGDTITLEGVFLSSDPASKSMSGTRYFTIKTNTETEFKKTTVTLPTAASLKAKDPQNKTGKYSFRFEDLPKVTSVGSLSELEKIDTTKSNILIEADFQLSRRAKTPVASIVSYQVMVKGDQK